MTWGWERTEQPCVTLTYQSGPKNQRILFASTGWWGMERLCVQAPLFRENLWFSQMWQELKSDEASSLNGGALDKLWTSWSLYKASNFFLKPCLFPVLTLLSSAVSGAGEWICVLSVAPVDRSHLRLQAERTGGHKGSQRFPLLVLWGLRELGHHHRPSAQRGKTPRLRGQWASIQRWMLIYKLVLRVWITLGCFWWVSIRHWPVLGFFSER